MPLYELTAIDPTAYDCRASTHSGAAIIRAPNERIARGAAAVASSIAVRRDVGRDVSMIPWRQASLVTARQIKDDRWPDESEIEILDPPHHNGEIAGVNWHAELE